MVENANVPVLHTEGKSLAEAWENAVARLFKEGCRVTTSYDKPGDPPSIEATLTYVVNEPLSEPMIHMCFPGGPADLEEYAMEVCEGIKDHWQRDITDPDDERWEYTYHARMFAYNMPDGSVVDQFEACARKLAGVEDPKATFKRSNQVSLWKPWEDPGWASPPCLQRIWFRILRGSDRLHYLNMNVHFRSRDAFDAAFMNSFAFIRLQQLMRDRVVELNPKLDLVLGRYMDHSDSFHIYGAKIEEVKSRFFGGIDGRNFGRRTARYEDTQQAQLTLWNEPKPTKRYARYKDGWKEMMDEERPRIIQKVKDYDATHPRM